MATGESVRGARNRNIMAPSAITAATAPNIGIQFAVLYLSLLSGSTMDMVGMNCSMPYSRLDPQLSIPDARNARANFRSIT